MGVFYRLNRQDEPSSLNLGKVSGYAAQFAAFAKTAQSDPINPLQPPKEEDLAIALKHLAHDFDQEINDIKSAESAVGSALDELGVSDAIREGCELLNGTVRATRVTDLDKVFFPEEHKLEGRVVSESMRGLLIALACSKDQSGNSMMPVRGHLFFHNIQNIWACTNPKCDYIHHSFEDSDRPIGALYGYHRVTCSCGSKVLDLLVCSVCGEVFLGGYRTPLPEAGSGEFLTADLPNIESLPDTVSNGLSHREYAVFWPTNTEEPVAPGGQMNPNYTWRGADCDW